MENLENKIENPNEKYAKHFSELALDSFKENIELDKETLEEYKYKLEDKLAKVKEMYENKKKQIAQAIAEKSPQENLQVLIAELENKHLVIQDTQRQLFAVIVALNTKE